MSDFFIGWDDGETLDLGPDFVETDRFDCNSNVALLNHVDTEISVAHELDGMYDEYLTSPTLAVEKPGVSLYTLFTSGFFHRIRVEANADRQYYHIRFCEVTMAYKGHLS